MTNPPSEERLPASFRDPSGYLFRRNGALYRQVNQSYREDYDDAISCGLFDKLISKGLLIEHSEAAELEPHDSEIAYKILKPRELPFVSYPYEWAFSQLKDAALLTLRIQREALNEGMSLKDASAYNVQFDGVRPVFIDTLSFERYVDGTPWVAYGQFCSHFLAPLALMATCDVRLSSLLSANLDGVPLDLAARLLPFRTRFRLGLLIHLILHARTQNRYADSAREKGDKVQVRLSKRKHEAILSNLESTIKGLQWRSEGTEWGDYYDNTSYSDSAAEGKAALVKDYLNQTAPKVVWDLGANNGRFSRIASEMGAFTVSSDVDPAAVEKNYRRAKAQSEKNILPLLIDLTNPSSGMGWGNRERGAFFERGRPDTILCLALVHHLAIGNNTPLRSIATLLADLSAALIVEFVPKEDPQVRRLLASREDIFPDYTETGFEKAFLESFDSMEKNSIPDSPRTLYLFRNTRDA